MTYLVAVSLDSLRMAMGVEGVVHGEDPDFTDRVIKGLIDSNRLRVIETDAPELVERVAAALSDRVIFPDSIEVREAFRDDARAAIEAVFDA
ncbi:MAG: hypothetical protein M3P18_00195 [Actinomycetota bacterium]|nr:hypothetical protein [Actinomycetota bacterium]